MRENNLQQMKAKLNPEIVSLLSKKTGLAPSTIPSKISRLQKEYPKCTPNAVAQIFAMQRGKTIWQKLSPEDKNSLPNIDLEAKKVMVSKKSSNKTEKKIKVIIEYETSDYHFRGHLQEINKAYTYGCYTSVFILTRKVIENLIIDILRQRYPPISIENKELYYSINQKRYKDFSILLENLKNKKHEFEIGKDKIIDRLIGKAMKFKDLANDVTHSKYHLIKSSSEIDELEIQSIIELIKALRT